MSEGYLIYKPQSYVTVAIKSYYKKMKPNN